MTFLLSILQAYQWWLEDMYFNTPIPLPINSSPGWVFPAQEFAQDRDEAVYLARIVYGMCRFKQVLER